jgi:hypothetical protein
LCHHRVAVHAAEPVAVGRRGMRRLITFSPVRACFSNAGIPLGGWSLVMIADAAYVHGVAAAESPFLSVAVLALVLAMLVMLNWKLTTGASRRLRVVFTALASVVIALVFVFFGIPLIYWFHLAIGGAE